MRRIVNPWRAVDGYSCFGCDASNRHGLKMEFYEDGDDIAARWRPEPYFQGYLQLLHGGIQSALLDEIASWVIFVKCETIGFTSSMKTRFVKPVFVNKGEISLTAKLKRTEKNSAVVNAKLFQQSGEIGSEAEVSFFVYPQEIAVKRYQYPGVEKFFAVQ